MFSLFVHLCFAHVFVLLCIPLFLVSLGEDTIAMVRQPLRSLRAPGIHHHLVDLSEKYCMGPARDGKKFPALENIFAFLLSTRAGELGFGSLTRIVSILG